MITLRIEFQIKLVHAFVNLLKWCQYLREVLKFCFLNTQGDKMGNVNFREYNLLNFFQFELIVLTSG
jgi:hypothetical protein